MVDFVLRKVMVACEDLEELTGHNFLIKSDGGGALINIMSRRDPRVGISYSEERSLFPISVSPAESLELIREFLVCEKLRVEALREIKLSEGP